MVNSQQQVLIEVNEGEDNQIFRLLLVDWVDYIFSAQENSLNGVYGHGLHSNYSLNQRKTRFIL